MDFSPRFAWFSIGVAERRLDNASMVQGLKPLATIILSLRDFRPIREIAQTPAAASERPPYLTQPNATSPQRWTCRPSSARAAALIRHARWACFSFGA